MKHFNNLKRALTPLLLFLAAAPAWAVNFSGTYTIPSAQFPDLNTACAQLTLGTVTGPTVFNITAGTYTGSGAQGIIGSSSGIAGVSATNTVIFQPATGVGTVTLNPTATSSTDNYVFRLINANYITIKDMTLSNTGSSYGIDIDLQGSSSYNTVSGCTLTGSTTTTTSSNKAKVYAYSGANATLGVTGVSNTITNNTILNASHAFYLYGSDGSTSTMPKPSGWVVSNNTITSPYYSTLYGYHMDGIQFLNNNSSLGVLPTTYLGIYMYNCDKAVQVINNSQVATSSSSTFYGLYQSNCDGSATQKMIVSGNTISNPNINCGTAYTFYLDHNTYDSIANNTFSAITTSCGSIYNYGMYCDYFTFKNNSITATGTTSGVYPMYVYGDYSNYNTNIVIDGNTFTGSVTSGYMYFQGVYDASNSQFTNNTLNLSTTSGGSVYNYAFSYVTNSICDHNTFNINGIGGSYPFIYGLYAYMDNSKVSNDIISNNKFSVSSDYYMYPLFHGGGSNSKIFNNTIITSGNAQYSYGLSNWYYAGRNDIYNNTVVNTCTSTSNYNFTQFAYNYSYYSGLTYWNNNIFYKTTGGGAPPICYG